MVTACAGCDSFQPWVSAVTGTGAGFMYMTVSWLMVSFRLDDPVDAVAVHGGGGLWGLLIAPVFMDNGVAFGGGSEALQVPKPEGGLERS